MGFSIATWNVNSLRARFKLLANFINKHQPDFIALQETKLQNHLFPEEILQFLGYHSVFHGQKSYNGVAFLSKWPVQVVDRSLPLDRELQCRFLSIAIGKLKIINIYAPNGSTVGSDKYQYKIKWFDALYYYLRDIFLEGHDVIVLGDYNIAPCDLDVYDPLTWKDKILTSSAERKAFFQLTQLGLIDIFRFLYPKSKQYTWWDYRSRAIHYNRGLRIDLVLCNHSLAKHCSGCIVDIETRLAQGPSDHAPFLAYFKKTL